MTDETWLSATAVDALVAQAADKMAALDEIDTGIETGAINGRYAKRIVVRSQGPRQRVDPGSLTAKIWKRVRANYPDAEVWSFREWRLCKSPVDPETILGGVELNEQQLRALLVSHGVPGLVPPTLKPPRKRSGGHNMAAHGAVITSLVIDLLKQPLHEVRVHTEETLAEELASRFTSFDAKREPISIENRQRMARQILARVVPAVEARDHAKLAA